MNRVISVFDIVGPVMIGPSSSHTAGAARLGLLARAIFGRTPESARIVLHGSFALTRKGHGTDLAVVAGLLGIGPDDPDIVRAFDIADERGMSLEIEEGDLGDVHPNSAKFDLSAEGETLTVAGSSTGGGDVVVTRIGEFQADVTGRTHLLAVAHVDTPGEIASVTSIISGDGANIAGMRVSRARRGADALMLIETDTALGNDTIAEIAALPGVSSVRAVPPV